MKQADRDLLLQRQVATGERNIELLERQVKAAEDQAKASVDISRRLATPKTTLPPLRRLARPRLDGLPSWDFEVPTENLRPGDFPTVICRCGVETSILLRIPVACEGDCGRFFLRMTDGSVRIKRFPKELEVGT